MEQQYFAAKVHFVAGKGGVGKTLIAKAMATMFAARHKTLLIELSEEDTGEARPQRTTIISHGEGNLFYVKIHPDQALYEYLCLKVPTKRVLDTLLSQSLFRALCAAMPGISDLTRLGKVWFHADEIHGSKEDIFEKVVVDMPSTGFVSRFLSIASVVQAAVKVGPMAKEARLIDEYFKKASHARIHLVALLQELVVSETIELYRQIKEINNIHFGALILNRRLVLASGQQKMPRDFRTLCPEISKVSDFINARIAEEEKLRDRFSKSGVALPQIIIGDMLGELVESKIISEMVFRLSGEQL